LLLLYKKLAEDPDSSLVSAIAEVEQPSYRAVIGWVIKN
jgi:hypothetical protein